MTPVRVIVIGFSILIFAGALILKLPISTRSGEYTGFLDALFTSTSAVCVTGLVVFDTNTHWSTFGHWVILFLIQVGGLGIMSFVTLFFLFAHKNMGLKEKLALQESLNKYTLSGVIPMLKKIIGITLCFELSGAILLCTRFIPDYGIGEGIKKSIFHSVSAFCNAGFDLTGNSGSLFSSFTPFNNDPVIIFTISILIITGGLGFMVWMDIASLRKNTVCSLGTKIILIGTVFLIVSGTLLIFLSEYNNPATLKDMSMPQKLMNSFFHSVTLRTAGFNTLPISEMNEATNFISILLMFIGAAPGSTAGGIKITTICVIVSSIFSFMQGHDNVNILRRRVPQSIIFKSMSIIALGFGLVIITTFVLLINGEGNLMQVLYESVSAFGTVGVSTGITPSLNILSKIQLILTMFIGRIGPFSAAAVFTISYTAKKQLYKYPEGKITVG